MHIVSPLYVLRHVPHDVQVYIQSFMTHPATAARAYRAALVCQHLINCATNTMMETRDHEVGERVGSDMGLFCKDALHEIVRFVQTQENIPSHLYKACWFYETNRICFFKRAIQRFYLPHSVRRSFEHRMKSNDM